ncbi:MAG: UpxY family transcription antiterminator [Bacteroidota bacterium]
MKDKEEKKWIAVYTKARAESTVTEKLESIGLTCFFPQQHRVRQWSDRKKTILVPLIPSYVFVYIEICKYHRVYESEAVVRVITFHNRAAIVRSSEIDLLRLACGDSEVTLESNISHRIGESVEITEGVFAGYSGIVVGKRESSKVAIQILELGLSVVISVPRIQVRLKEVV